MECGGRAQRRHRFGLRAERALWTKSFRWVGSASKKSAVATPFCRRTPKLRPTDLLWLTAFSQLLIVIPPAHAQGLIDYITPHFTTSSAPSGVHIDADHARWRAMSGNIGGQRFSDLKPMAYDSGSGWWEDETSILRTTYEAGSVLGQHPGINQEPAPYLVFQPAITGNYAVAGVVAIDETGLDDGTGLAKTRFDLWLFPADDSPQVQIGSTFVANLPAGNGDTNFTLTGAAGLQNIVLSQGDRVGLTGRKVGSPGTVRVDISDVTLTGPDGFAPIPSAEVVIDRVVSIAFTTETGVYYAVQGTTDLTAGAWADLPYLFVGTGSPLKFCEPAATDTVKQYRVLEARP